MDFSGRPSDVPMRVSHLIGDGVHATVGGIPAFGTYLHRLAIGCDYDVVHGVAIASAILQSRHWLPFR